MAVRVAFAPTVTPTALAVRADSHTHDTLSLNRPANKCSLYLYAYVLAFLFVKLYVENVSVGRYLRVYRRSFI